MSCWCRNLSSHQSFYKLLSLLFIFLLVLSSLKLSLVVFASFGPPEICDRDRDWLQTSLLHLTFLTLLPLKTRNKETLASKWSSNTKSEIGLTISSRAMDSRTTFVILASQVLHRTSRTLITSPLSSKRPWPYLITVHSDGIHTVKRSRTAVAPEQKLTAEGFDKSRLAQFLTRKMMDSGKTLIFLMGLPLSLLFPGLLSFSPWPIFNTLGPSHPVADFRTAFNYSKNLSLLMLRFSDSYGRGLHSGWISTSTLWFCDDIDDCTQLQSSTTKPRQYLILSINWLWLARVQAFVYAEYELLVVITTDPFPKDPTSIHTLLLWIQHPPKEPIHWTLLTAGDNLGPLLASYPVSMSRTHDNFSFGGIVFVSENCSRFGESKFPPSPFSLMFRLYGLIGRGLPSGLEMTSLDWPWDYLLQTLRLHSSSCGELHFSARLPYVENFLMQISFFMERTLWLIPSFMEWHPALHWRIHAYILSLLLSCAEESLCLTPLRSKVLDSDLTSNCQPTMTMHHLPDFLAIMVSTYQLFDGGIGLCCSYLRVVDLPLKYLIKLSYAFINALNFVVLSFALVEPLNCVVHLII